MRLTINQLRRIIKEEISRSTTRSRRTLREMAEANYSLKIDNVSRRSADEFAQFSAYAERSPEFRSSHRRPSKEDALIAKIDLVISEDDLYIDHEYSKADDSLLLFGGFEDLKQLARRIDSDLIDEIQEEEEDSHSLTISEVSGLANEVFGLDLGSFLYMLKRLAPQYHLKSRSNLDRYTENYGDIVFYGPYRNLAAFADALDDSKWEGAREVPPFRSLIEPV